MTEAIFPASAEDAEKRMAGFMDHQIGKIENQEFRPHGRGVKQEEQVERNGDDGAEAGDGLPVVESEGGQGHRSRVAARRNLAADSCGGVFRRANTRRREGWPQSHGETEAEKKERGG